MARIALISAVLVLKGCQLTVGADKDLGSGTSVGTSVTLDPKTGVVLGRGVGAEIVIR